MEAARLESGSAGGFVAFFATNMTVLERTGRNLMQAGYEVIRYDLGATVAWRLGLRLFLQAM